MALHENFRDYTKEEIYKIKKDICLKHKCRYLSRVSDYSSVATVSNNFCSYLEWTGHMRDCMPDECTHYLDEGSTKKGKFFNFDDGYNKI